MGVKKRVPVPRKPTRDNVIDELKAFGRGRRLRKGVKIRDLVNEGRRF
jgi:hypothetical protein